MIKVDKNKNSISFEEKKIWELQGMRKRELYLKNIEL